MAGLIILNYSHDLSDEVLCERWVDNPYDRFFCGEEFFQGELVLAAELAVTLAPARTELAIP